MFKRLFFVVVSALLVSSFILSCSQQKFNEVHIACNLPLTGDLATYGEAVRDGVTMALDDISTKNGPSLKFDWQDNAGQPKAAVNILKKQLLKRVDIYISGVKPQTMAIIDQISAKKIPHFVWIFDAFVCRDYVNTFRTWVSYKIEPIYYLKYVNKVKPKKIAIVYVNLPHAEEEFKKILIPELNKIGINDIFLETYPWTKKDYKDIAAKVKEFGPDLIILNGFKATIIGLIKSLRESNQIKDGNTIVTYDMLDAAEELPADVIEGIRAIVPIFNIQQENELLNEWKEKFERKFKRKPRYTDAYAYDMAMIIYDAAKRLRLPADHQQWAEALKSTKLDGITGPLEFDNDGDLKISLEIGVYRNGKLLPDK